MLFTEISTLKEILEHEKGAEILEKYEVPCLSCPMAPMESGDLTIGIICDAYDLNLEAILKDLNR